MPGMLERILHATSIMHSYAHQWECQLVFNPRMLSGVGLTDGEGSERLWSRICMLIPILRHVSVRRRFDDNRVATDVHMTARSSTNHP